MQRIPRSTRRHADRAPDPRLHFRLLSREEQIAAVRRMAAQNWTEVGIAAATAWSVEAVRQALAESRQ
jgi:hypothetical protein